MTQQNKSIKEKYMTAPFRVSYPSVFEPVAAMGNENKKIFSLTMLFPKKSIVDGLTIPEAIKALIARDNCAAFYSKLTANARANFGPEVDLKSIRLTKFRDGDKPKEQSGKIEENEKGYIVVRTTTDAKFKPQVFRMNKTPMTDPTELYPGCWARAVLEIAPFYKPNRGVTIYLVGVQKLADDVTFSSRPRCEDEFDSVASEEPQTGTGSPAPAGEDLGFLE